MALGKADTGVGIVNTIFSNNSAKQGSGAAVTITTVGTDSVYFDNATFEHNEASPFQGAVYHATIPLLDLKQSSDSSYGSVNIINSRFTNNIGGCITGVGSYLAIDSCRFESNQGGSGSGAINCNSCLKMYVAHSKLLNNTSSGAGGAIRAISTGNSALVVDNVIANNNRFVIMTG